MPINYFDEYQIVTGCVLLRLLPDRRLLQKRLSYFTIRGKIAKYGKVMSFLFHYSFEGTEETAANRLMNHHGRSLYDLR